MGIDEVGIDEVGIDKVGITPVRTLNLHYAEKKPKN